MSLPSTDWLRELRSAITPGPWEYDFNDVTEDHIVWADGEIVMREDLALPSPDHNWQLAALAPELLDEVIRLREAIDRLQRHTRMQSGFNCLASDIADALHIILEGDHDA